MERRGGPGPALRPEGGEEVKDSAICALDLRCHTAQGIRSALQGFRQLKVLVLSGSSLQPDDLGLVLQGQGQLEKLDASSCGLRQLPSEELWEGLEKLRLLFLHSNELRSWTDLLAAVRPPNLAWLTFHCNPISSQPDYRLLALERRPQLLALDFWLVLDGERLGVAAAAGAEADPGRPGFRFSTAGAPVPMAPASRQAAATEDLEQASFALLREHRSQLAQLQQSASQCSAAGFVQGVWRKVVAQRFAAARRVRTYEAATRIQRCMKAALWKRQMNEYVKDYLAEIDELDLLLNAKEMLRRKAMKLIEVSVHRWWERRKLKKRERQAAELLTRAVRGWLVRMRTFYDNLQFAEFPRLYFPQRHAWEFLVLLNVVRQRHGLPPLPREHAFEDADALGVRFPEAEEAPLRSSSLLALRRFARLCVVRPRRAGRCQEVPWDGPMHRLVDTPPQRIKEARARLRRHYANVDNRCRRAFLQSCAQGRHPIEATGLEPARECLALALLLEGPEAQWPDEAAFDESLLRTFLLQARRTGAKTYRRLDAGLAAPRGAEGVRDYSAMCWLTQRLLCHRCESPKIAGELAMALLVFAKLAPCVPSLEAVPFLPEKLLRQASAAAALQAAFRAHRERLRLGCGLQTAVVARRAALCLQRCWRWSLLKRRLQLLAGAASYVKAVRSSVLYVEERLFTALNVIQAVDRYPPLLAERRLRLGVSEEAVLLVREGKTASGSRRSVQASRPPLPRSPGPSRPGRSGLPAWLLAHVGGLAEVAAEDPSLKRVVGLHGLLTEGVERNEDHAVTLPITSFAHMARQGEGRPGDERLGASLEATGGQLRFVELRFQSLAQAKQRAFVLFMCTFNSHYRTVVPLQPRQMLHDSSVVRSVLQQWELYGLHWSPTNRVGAYRLRQRLQARGEEAVLCCGGDLLWSVPRPCEWGESQDKAATGWESRRAALREDLCAKYEGLAGKVGRAREKQEAALARKLQALDPEDARRTLAAPAAPAGMTEVCVAGAAPPCTAARREEVPGEFGRREKAAAREAIAEAAEREAERKRRGREAVEEWKTKGKEGSGFEDRLMAFYERAEEQERQQRISQRVAEPQRSMGYRYQMHVLAEKAINARAEQLEKLAEVDRFKATATETLEACAVERLEELQQRREEIQQERAERKARKKAKEVLRTYLSKKSCIERVCAREDRHLLSQAREKEAVKRVVRQRREWARRSRALAAKHYDCIHQRRRQVDELREQLASLKEERRRLDEEEVQKIRHRIAQDASLSRLMKAAQEQLDRYAMALQGSGKAAGEYEDTLKVFQDLSQKLDSVEQEEEELLLESGRSASSSPPPGRRQHSEPPPGPSAPRARAPLSSCVVQLPSLPSASKPGAPPAPPASARLDANKEAKAWLRRFGGRAPLSAR